MEVIVKIVDERYLNKGAVRKVVYYIHRGARWLPPNEQIVGSVGLFCGDKPKDVIREMRETKRIFDAADGVQLKHIVVSFGTKLNLPRKKIRKLILRTLGQWKDRYQMYYGMHYEVNDEGFPNYHLHLMVNSVDMITGKKMDLKRKEWKKFCKQTKRIWQEVVDANNNAQADG